MTAQTKKRPRWCTLTPQYHNASRRADLSKHNKYTPVIAGHSKSVVNDKMRAVSVESAVATSVVALTGLLGAVWMYQRHRNTQKDNKPPAEWREVATIQKIHLYPLKSGRRVELQSAECTKFGLKHNSRYEKALQLYDRSFLVVGAENGEFKTARTFPKMVLIEVGVHDEWHVSFEAPGMRQLYVKIPKEGDVKATKITLHQKEEIFALDCGDEAASWCSRYIYGKDTGLRLVFHDAADEHKRDLRPTHQKMLNNYTELNTSTGLYSDLTAVMMINQASVDDLNTKIESDTVITSENFRPNLIISGDGAPPFIEDYWAWIKIGDVILKNVKPCTRCMFTTIDPENGTRNQDREPLHTLEKYRKLKNVLHKEYEGELTVMGAMLGVHQGGEINVGDTIYVGI